jgi:hypothetical protein
MICQPSLRQRLVAALQIFQFCAIFFVLIIKAEE